MPTDESYKAGAVIYFEGDTSGSIYLIRRGTVEVAHEITSGNARKLSPGEFVGLSDSLGGLNRIGTARAATDTVVSVITAEELRGMLGGNVQIGLKIITSLCAELREIDEHIVERMRHGRDQLGADKGLLTVAEHFREKNMTRPARYAYAHFIETDPPRHLLLDAALILADLCEKDGEINAALEIYEKLALDFPEDGRSTAAAQRLRTVVEAFRGAGA